MISFKDKNNEPYEIFKHNIKSGMPFEVTGLVSVLRMFLALKAGEFSDKKILYITSSEQNALKYKNDFEKIFDINAEILPYQNISLYENISSNKYDYAEQIRVLLNRPQIIIAPVKSLMEKFPAENFYYDNSLKIKIGDEINTANFAQNLVRLGYKKSTMVSDIQEFSIRGDIIDVYPPGDYPVRIELWGDEVVDLRYFNNETQKSVEKISETEILPIYKFIVSGETELSEEEGYFDGIEVYQSYFNKNLVTVFDYLKDYIIVVDEASEVFAKYEMIDKNYENQLSENIKSELIKPLESKNHVTFEDFEKSMARFMRVNLDNFIDSSNQELVEFNTEPVRNFAADFEEITKFIFEKSDFNIIISTDYPERVREVFLERGIYKEIEFIPSIAAHGCILSDFQTVILTDRELFNKRNKEITSAKRSYYKEKAEYIENINDIQEGEYVVHRVHGVGIYKGLTQQEIDGQAKDYLTIEYASNDKLHIPAEQINLLCRYRGSGSIKPKLSRMGGKDWENTKSRVKKEVEQVAYDLLRLYARRKMQKGIQFLPDTNWQVEMEDAFEYTETPDQMRAISEVKNDMECENPMDRLICGDVGFGKTEVAMRAIFKAITSGKQAAVIVPTTILALQHFQTMSERFSPFGVKVELLSRFRTAKEQKETIKHLAVGECDVVIGTHRLLQNGIVFKDLGLLVIDEEHRFGVRHKEKIKQLRENIDIITMSATPIPRTLYMSLSGIKDMSVINTPPKNRLPIKTYVGGWNENVVKNAITHELDREGQVFYLYNRVETIEEFKYRLQLLVPNARIAVGHGQMDEKQLEQVIVDFANHEYDILLATTIIENGIDIPNANTMIIHDADKFGLAQLYQLRGRVGRSERQAYCYCLYKQSKEMTADAVQRLKAIKEFTTLGSGYQIALRDVEIRGIGNILGTKQHGHMVNVGFDTYCRLLEETVHELQGEHIEDSVETIVDINATAFIPDEWVGSKEQKMIEYKRLADVKNNAELDYITEEWRDRFSKPPQSVENLIKLIKIRLAATDVKISLIRETAENIRIYTPYTHVEWKLIQPHLPSEILKRVKYMQAPASCKEGVSILLLNNSYMNFDEIFNILTDLFYYIHKVSNNYSR